MDYQIKLYYMENNYETFRNLDEALTILSCFNTSLPIYLQRMDADKKVQFMEELRIVISGLREFDDPLALQPFFDLLKKTPVIWKEFFPDEIRSIRFTKEDVAPTNNPQKKIREVENEVPVLDEMIGKILDDLKPKGDQEKKDA